MIGRHLRRVVAAGVAGLLGVSGVVVSGAGIVASGTVASAAVAPSTALVLYDTTGAYGFLGEQYAEMTVNLASHFGTVTAKPVSTYTAGMINSYTAVIYLGSTYDEPIPTAFLDDVLTSAKPVLWLDDNIWQLTNRQFVKTGQYWANVRGWDWTGFDTSSVAEVDYKGQALGRYAADASGILNITVNNPAKATVLATAKRADGTTFPWATRSGNLTYIGEMPLSYIEENNRYLAFSDLLFDALAPTTTTRHRALVRIEDVGPDADPTELRTVADTLSAAGVPFTVAVIPEYRDPTGVNDGGVPTFIQMSQAPLVVSALKYMQTKGGTLIMHGWTHQIDGLNNPYNQVSADDFEFFKAHVDPATNNVVYDGSLPTDSQSAQQTRINNGKARLAAAGLTAPTIFEFPHYAASKNAYAAAKATFATRYDRGLYFSGLLKGGTVSTTQFVGQFFPYPVNDLYGNRVIPENLGNEELDAFNNHPPRLPADLVANAKANLVVRDGFASFFWHPYLVSDPRAGIKDLSTIVSGIKALGYTFVSSPSIATAATPSTFAAPQVTWSASPIFRAALNPLGALAAQKPLSNQGPGSANSNNGDTEDHQGRTLNRKPIEPISLGAQHQRHPDRGVIESLDT